MKVGITIRHNDWKWCSAEIIEPEYYKYYSKLGLDLILISINQKDPIEFCKRMNIEGFIFTGGNGVNPKEWNEEITTQNLFSDQRDQLQKELTKYAIKKNLPILGICHGLHFLNVYFGGKLIQDISTISNTPHAPINNKKIPHSIQILEEKNYLGESAIVNTFHKQGITSDLLGNLKPFAICSNDNTIEAANHPNYPFAGVTWHPERESPNKEFNLKIITAFKNRKLFWK